jgi:3-(3-hydroxy-phenyl)propionate hydroxylase
MLPQPMVKLTGHERPLDYWFGCHEWLALGVGVDPRSELSPRDGAILDGLGARFLAINSAAVAIPTLGLQCQDQSFLAWAKSHSVRGILVRPDRFIAQRLDRRSDLRSLNAFAAVADKQRRIAEIYSNRRSNRMAVV